jgi:hypothetical protein
MRARAHLDGGEEKKRTGGKKSEAASEKSEAGASVAAQSAFGFHAIKM